MRRRTSNIGRLTRRAKKERQRRLNRTPEERLEFNKRYRVKTYQKRAEESPEQREKRLKMVRIDRKKRRAALASQQRRQKLNQVLKEVQLQHLNNQALKQDPIAFSYEPAIFYCTLCKSIQIENLDKVCMHCKSVKVKEEIPETVSKDEK